MFAFDLPWALALWPLPVLFFWVLPAYRDQSEAVRAPFFARLVDITGAEPTPGAVVVTKNRYQKANVALTWSLIVVALAQPVWVDDAITREVAARDMLLMVDLSGSMEAEDFVNAAGERMTRLAAVKQVVDEFISRREGDRLALAVFGTAAFPQASFTEDREVIRSLLAELEPRMAGPQTMIGDVIGLAVRLFEASEKTNKVGILLTDGNDTGSKMPVAKAAAIAAENGITLHAIAMGDPETVGEQALDVTSLEQIAARTQGRFFLALDREALQGIYAELDRLEPDLRQTISYRPKRSLFHYPLGAVILLGMVLGLVMTYGKVPAVMQTKKLQRDG